MLDAAEGFRAATGAFAALDVALCLARIASERDWARPEMREDPSFEVEGGRQPFVERALRDAGGESFVPNDCDLTADGANATPLWIVTVPNMAGKSTFLRQNSLIAVIAQAGSFVPSRRARIGVVERLFSHVGAADVLARERSTLLVETTAILYQTSERSLVILDEIGRVTATYDALTIAWAAVLEHLRAVNGSRALFATHIHELTRLAETLTWVRNTTVRVTEWKGKLVFLHEVANGVADRFYGVQVARLAGLPDALIARASELLEALENRAREPAEAPQAGQPSLFDPPPPDYWSRSRRKDDSELRKLASDGGGPRGD